MHISTAKRVWLSILNHRLHRQQTLHTALVDRKAAAFSYQIKKYACDSLTLPRILIALKHVPKAIIALPWGGHFVPLPFLATQGFPAEEA